MTRPPFRIDRLLIENFRGIDELELEFTHEAQEGGLVVLAGDNGCGKTAVLDAIVLIFLKTDLLPEIVGHLRDDVAFGSKEYFIEALLSSRQWDQPVPHAVNTETFLAPAQPRATSRSQLPDLTDVMVRHSSSSGYANNLSATLHQLSPEIEYYSARRQLEDLGRRPTDSQLHREGHRLFSLKQRLVNTFYRSLRKGNQGLPTEEDPFGKLQKFIGTFLEPGWELDVIPLSNDPSSGDEVVIRRGGLIPADITSFLQARESALQRDGVPAIVPLDRLSSGQLSLFAFAGPLIFRDAPADIVLLDEPEQHMHPSWQKLLLGALRDLSPQSQFIVATHSLDILESAMNHERHLLLRNDDPRARDWDIGTTRGDEA